MEFNDYIKIHFEDLSFKKTIIDKRVLDVLKDLQINDAHKIIDVGCGQNLYKKYYNNIVGLDIVDYGADIVSSIQDAKIKKETFDIALCLGVFHGSFNNVTADIEKISSWVKPGGYIICRARQNSMNYRIEVKNNRYFNLDVIDNYSKKFNLCLLKKYLDQGEIRYSWVWQKNET